MLNQNSSGYAQGREKRHYEIETLSRILRKTPSRHKLSPCFYDVPLINKVTFHSFN